MTPYVVCLACGLFVGVIVNWLADQLPMLRAGDQESDDDTDAARTVKTASLEALQSPVCVRCGSPRPLLAWTGVTAWISGKRGCLQCGNLLSARYPLVEVLVGLSFAYLFGRFGLSGVFLPLAFYLPLFALIAVIDMEHRFILNIVMIPAFAIALFEIAVGDRATLKDALEGYALAQILVFAIYFAGGIYLWFVNRGRQDQVTEVAFGFGDVTLATFCGMVIGYPNVVYMLVLMVLFGGLAAILYVVFQLIASRKYRTNSPIPYGPAILVATTVMLLWPDLIIRWIYGPH